MKRELKKKKKPSKTVTIWRLGKTISVMMVLLSSYSAEKRIGADTNTPGLCRQMETKKRLPGSQPQPNISRE